MGRKMQPELFRLTQQDSLFVHSGRQIFRPGHSTFHLELYTAPEASPPGSPGANWRIRSMTSAPTAS